MFRAMNRLFSAKRSHLVRERAFKAPITKFREDTVHIRDLKWKAAPTPEFLQRRWVELTGPGNDAKMVLHAMNSSADGYMLDLEDSMAPTKANVLAAHENIRGIVRGDLTWSSPEKTLRLVPQESPPAFMVRVRGLHMPEDATIYDVCEFLEHSGRALYEEGRGPYIYMPKLQTYEEAEFVDTLLKECEDYLGLPKNCVKVTALVETFPAIFQTDEIAYAMKDRIVGLNCGRWDYLFSMIQSLSKQPFMDRSDLTMTLPFMEAYVRQIVHTCHKRNIHAMGGMSAFIPTKGDTSFLDIVKDDKALEISRGCDGAWVAHPGLIEPVQALFEEGLVGDDHQKDIIPVPVRSEELMPHLMFDSYSRSCLDQNVKVASKYVDEWLSGNGAVAIDGMMEDLATAEISLTQLKNWVAHGKCSRDDIRFDGNPRCQYVLNEYLDGDYAFLHDVAAPALAHERGFTPIEAPEILIPAPKTGIELTRSRGAFLKTYLDSHPSYGFLGTSNGVSAVNVVAGGNGHVGPYAGGWQANAMKNRLQMLLPDTLHVAPEDVSTAATEFNEHLYKAMLVQEDAGLDDIQYDQMALLADLEQGWNTPEKTRIGVRKAVEAGVNVIHIEDQGDKKRCGHLGDKELNSYEDYALIMRSANLAAREMRVHDAVTFVARTDAYSARRIHYSSHLTCPDHPEHKFIDWERGPTPDGKYLFIKEGTNPETGNRWGLDLSIYRGYRVVSDGLASHVWMETPDADLKVAKDFLDGVNAKLAPEGKRAYGLYNHSPSFDWDVKFEAEAKPLAAKVANDIVCHIIAYGNSMADDSFYRNRLLSSSYHSTLVEMIRASIAKHGDEVRGDVHFSDEAIEQMIPHLIDRAMGPDDWARQLESESKYVPTTSLNAEISTIKLRKMREGYRPEEHIADIIVDERLRNFGPQLASFGYNMHLITLPEFHVTAYRMHDLAKRFQTTGIEAFVTTTQRPERMTSSDDPTYTYYKHQTATGTGVEAAFNKAVGSTNVNALSESTESDDLQKRN